MTKQDWSPCKQLDKSTIRLGTRSKSLYGWMSSGYLYDYNTIPYCALFYS
jgi:hypothetical protein